MKNRYRSVVLTFVMAIVSFSTPLTAHHGSAISYDMDHPWTTKATVTEFKYANPHPWLSFERVNDKGQTEQWKAELVTNPTFLLRAGWTKSRSIEALKPGTVVELTLATSRVGGFVGCIRTIKNEKGEYIVTSGGAGGDGPVLFPGRGAGEGAPAGSRGRE